MSEQFTPGSWSVDGTTVYSLEWDGQSYEGKGNEYRQRLTNRWSASLQGLEKRISRDELVAAARLIAAAPDLHGSLDPDTLEAIADEIDGHEHSARAASLRGIAKRQRVALAKASPPALNALSAKIEQEHME